MYFNEKAKAENFNDMFGNPQTDDVDFFLMPDIDCTMIDHEHFVIQFETDDVLQMKHISNEIH